MSLPPWYRKYTAAPADSGIVEAGRRGGPGWSVPRRLAVGSEQGHGASCEPHLGTDRQGRVAGGRARPRRNPLRSSARREDVCAAVDIRGGRDSAPTSGRDRRRGEATPSAMACGMI